MADYWAAKGWKVTLVTYIEGDNYYNVSTKVCQVSAYVSASGSGLLTRTYQAWRRLVAIRQAISASHPQVVLSFLAQPNVRVLIATIGLKIPIIVCERNDPYFEQTRPSFRLLRCWLYARANFVVTQTEAALDYFPSYIRARSCIIPNPVPKPVDASPRKSGANRIGKIVMAMGRLADQKGFDLLLEAFALVAQQHQEWSLYIWGEGEQRSALETLAAHLNVSPSLSSRYEKGAS